MAAVFVTKAFTFDAAHRLNNYNGKCANLHGHTYRLEVTFSGEPVNNGMVMDFGDVKKLVTALILDHMDHAYLNEFFGSEFQPTAENMAIWIHRALSGYVKQHHSGIRVHRVRLFETPDSWADYYG